MSFSPAARPTRSTPTARTSPPLPPSRAPGARERRWRRADRSLRAGEGNSWLLAWRAAMQEAGLAPATINRRLSAVRSALRFARTIGATTWVPEISGLKAQTYRDTRGPGLDGHARVAAGSGGEVARQGGARHRDHPADVRPRSPPRRGPVGLDVDDVDRDGRRLWVLGKGKAQKEARTLPAPTLEAIDRWLADARSGGAAETSLRSGECRRSQAGAPDDGQWPLPRDPKLGRSGRHQSASARPSAREHHGRPGHQQRRRAGCSGSCAARQSADDDAV